jgi:fluoroquinolone transport system permease protein
MTHFFQLLRWETILLHRNNLLVISIVITVAYLALFQLLKLLGHQELFAMLLVLNDPALIGFLFAAVTIIFEKESGSFFALRVTPMSLHGYLFAKLVILGLLGTVCGWPMAVGLLGFDIHHGIFMLTCFLITMLFGSLGIGMVARVKRFVDLMLPMAGALLLMILPLAEWFGLFPVPLKWIFPMEHGIRIMAWSFRNEIQDFPWASLFIFVLSNVVFYAWAFWRFRKYNNG